MYPTHLNLLPPQKRANIQRMIYVQYIKNIFEIILIILCLSGMILLGGEWMLQKQFNAFVGTLTTISNQQAAKNKKIREVNNTFAIIERLQKKYFLWTPILESIALAVPDHITLSELLLDEKEKKYTVQGIADTRADLLLLQKNLQEIHHIKTVVIPVSALTAKEHIPFSIEADVK